MAIVTLKERMTVHKWSDPDSRSSEERTFIGAVKAITVIGIDLVTRDYGVVGFPWSNILGVQEEEYRPPPEPKKKAKKAARSK